MSNKGKISRRFFFFYLSKKIIIGLSAFCSFKSIAYSESNSILRSSSTSKLSIFQILKEIHKEIIELGSYGDHNFIKREFFIELDGNRENKEEQVVLLNNRVGDREKMIVQVTYFESERKNSNISYAKETKKILCFFEAGKIEIKESDYDQVKLQFLLTKILAGIRNEKKLLKMIKRK